MGAKLVHVVDKDALFVGDIVVGLVAVLGGDGIVLGGLGAHGGLGVGHGGRLGVCLGTASQSAFLSPVSGYLE